MSSSAARTSRLAVSALARLRLPRDAAIALTAVAGLTFIMFRPVSNNLLLYTIFALLGLVASVALFRHRKVAPELLVVAFFVAGLAAYGLAVGGMNSGLPFTLLVWALSPGLYLICASAATPFALRAFFWGAAIATIGVGALIILFVYGEAGTIPQLIPRWLEQQTGLGATFRGSASQARSFGLSSLNALGPLWAASLILRRDQYLPPWPVRLCCFVIASSAALASSRSAILLVIVVAPLVALVVRVIIRKRPFAPGRLQPRFAGAGLAVGSLTVGALAFAAPRLQSFGPVTTAFQAVTSFFTGTSSGAGADESIRADQAAHLLHAWSMNPLFGSGFGSQIPEYARTSERPWVLELQYHLFLFNVGLVGLALAICIGIVAVVFIRRAVTFAPEFEPTMIVSTTVAISMLIANATNPYLQAPGHMWAIFLPLAVAQVILRTSPEHRSRRDSPTLEGWHARVHTSR